MTVKIQVLTGLLLLTWEITKPIHLAKIDEWAFGFTCGVLKRERARMVPNRLEANVYEFLLDGEVDDCALGDRAGGGFDGDDRRSGRSGWDEDVARAGTARDEAGGDQKDAE